MRDDEILHEMDAQFDLPVATACCDSCGADSGHPVDPQSFSTLCPACRETWTPDLIRMVSWLVENIDADETGFFWTGLPRRTLEGVFQLALGSLHDLLRCLPPSAIAYARHVYLRSLDDDDHADRGGLAAWLAIEAEFADRYIPPSRR